MVKTWNESKGCYDVVTDSRELEAMTRAIAEASHSLHCAQRVNLNGGYYVAERITDQTSERIGQAMDAAGFNAEGGMK